MSDPRSIINSDLRRKSIPNRTSTGKLPITPHLPYNCFPNKDISRVAASGRLNVAPVATYTLGQSQGAGVILCLTIKERDTRLIALPVSITALAVTPFTNTGQERAPKIGKL